MALFRHHISFGALVGVVACTFAYYYALVSDMRLLVTLLTVTIVGSLLPDLDSDSGIPFYTLFGLITLLTGGVALYATLLVEPGNVRMLIGVPIVVMVLVWFVGGGMFKVLTNHRGMMHSIPAALIAGALGYIAAVSLQHEQYDSLMIAIALSIGYVSHLVLDELHAGVNLDGTLFRPKQSLGSALKFFSSSRFVNLCTYVTLITVLRIALTV
jgi:membrane-bound metal-dependent hydrolase YbcI (DUF457 family)